MHLFCFGYGYTASFLASKVLPLGWHVSGTYFTQPKEASPFLLKYGDPEIEERLKSASHILISIPPHGDTVLERYKDALKYAKWIGYLSATSVYGRCEDRPVEETSATEPTEARGIARLQKEHLWINSGLPVHVFRLAAIYGPHRNVLNQLVENRAIFSFTDHVFSRIHVEDIVNVLFASMLQPNPISTYNCADDLPTPHSDVVLYGASLLHMPPPSATAFQDMPEGIRSFYTARRFIGNSKIKNELGVCLLYPNYKVGLLDILSRYFS